MIKCVIWDLDNTLWSGILTENDEIQIKDEMVRILKAFYKKGVINSISSKNDFDTAKDVLVQSGLWDYFIYPQIDWNPKSVNVKKIVTDLHFREQNVLFIDDNPFELDEVKSSLKDITVCQAEDYEELEDILKNCKKSSTTEVNQRNQMYRTEVLRIQKQEEMQLSTSEFLKTCNIRIHIKLAEVEDLCRMGELIERTNQINSTGIRYTEDEIKEMIASKDLYDVFVAEVEDNYGSYGRSALVIAKKHETVYEISLLIVSCRLLGKGISQAMLAYVANSAIDNGFNVIRCLFKRTKFNRPMIMLYVMNGFQRAGEADTLAQYERERSSGKVDIPEWVNINFEEGAI